MDSNISEMIMEPLPVTDSNHLTSYVTDWLTDQPNFFLHVKKNKHFNTTILH